MRVIKSWRTLFVGKILLLTTCVGLAENIQPFTSDGCSAFPDGSFEHKTLWLNCCRQHDYAYWQGGSYQQRVIADKQLRYCVSEVGEPEIALLMLLGVRLGGSPYFPTSFRWGYGWSYPRGYQALTKEERKQVSRYQLNGVYRN